MIFTVWVLLRMFVVLFYSKFFSYRMLCGVCPVVRNAKKEKLMEFLKKGLPTRAPTPFNPNLNISQEGQDFCMRLLAKDPTKRLGHGLNGANDIKSHPWFANDDSINFDEIMEYKVAVLLLILIFSSSSLYLKQKKNH